MVGDPLGIAAGRASGHQLHVVSGAFGMVFEGCQCWSDRAAAAGPMMGSSSRDAARGETSRTRTFLPTTFPMVSACSRWVSTSGPVTA